MARSNELKKAVVRNTRYFSEEFKRKKVKELDKRITSIADICKEYEVSNTAVYKWVYKYSLMRKKGVKMVVEPESDTARIKALKQHISELEQMLGKKQFEIDFIKKQMEIASEQYGVDFKKKPSGHPSSGSGNTGESTTTK
ncbi:MAG TPA: transposase [Flavisolibacter sp.]|nr:transposase [Flavisolibacter sp.]